MHITNLFAADLIVLMYLFLVIRLNFQFCPSSKVHGFSTVDLKPNGEDEVEHYCCLPFFILFVYSVIYCKIVWNIWCSYMYILSPQMVTMDNAEEYVELMFDFCMHTGIQKQMEAFRGRMTTNFIILVP